MNNLDDELELNFKDSVINFLRKYPYWIILTSVLLIGFVLNNWAYQASLEGYKHAYLTYQELYFECNSAANFARLNNPFMVGGVNVSINES